MNDQEVEAFRERLGELLVAGSERAIRSFVDESFPRLPTDIQNEIVTNAFLTSLEDEAEELGALVEQYDEGIAAAEVLVEVQEEVGKQGIDK